MDNIIKTLDTQELREKLYNYQLKIDFIMETYGGYENDYFGTLNAVDTFKVSSQLEYSKDKDLFMFSKYDVEELLMSFKATQISSLNTRLVTLRKYIDYTQNIHYNENPLNVFRLFFKSEDLKKYINQNQHYIYVSRDYLYDIARKMFNAQDAVLFILPFEGIKGNELSEMRLLRKQDIDFDNKTIYIRDEQGLTKRIMTDIDERSLEIIHSAIKQREYLQGNQLDNISQDLHEDDHIKIKFRRKSQFIDLNPNSDYVIKGVIERNSENEPVIRQLIPNRMIKIKNWFRKYDDNPALINLLSPTNLWYSGMVDNLLRIKKEKNILTTDDYKKVIMLRGLKEDSYQSLKGKFILLYTED